MRVTPEKRRKQLFEGVRGADHFGSDGVTLDWEAQNLHSCGLPQQTSGQRLHGRQRRFGRMPENGKKLESGGKAGEQHQR